MISLGFSFCLNNNSTPKVKLDNQGNEIEVIKLDSQEGTDTGLVLPNFEQSTPNGEQLSLAQYRGHYTLVDFWAAWCNPCRKENPNLVKVYNAYKSKGFKILSVSLDRNKENWVQAIKDDNLNWDHVSDLKFWDNEVAVRFSIQAIPANFLLDPQGIIIAKNSSSKELAEILSQKLN